MNLYNDQPQHAGQLPEAGPGHSPQRRRILMTGLGVGFALAANPLLAQVVHTTAEGIEASEIKIPTSDGDIPGYRAMPAQGGPFPTIVVIEEIFGLHEYIKDICRRLAKLGYYAVAPELFAREGNPLTADINTILKDIVPKVPDAQAMSDLDATVAFAKASGKADTDKRGTIGFCWGGRMVWLFAEHDPKLKAAVAFYGILGGMASPTSSIKPTNPIDFGAKVTVPVLGLYGGQDSNIPGDLIAKMQAELKQGGHGSEIVVYPDAPHGFFADYRPSYRPADAKDAWPKALAWFKDHGVA